MLQINWMWKVAPENKNLIFGLRQRNLFFSEVPKVDLFDFGTKIFNCCGDKCYINIKHSSNSKHNPTPYTAPKQKPNHYPRSLLSSKISSQEQLLQEQMSDHRPHIAVVTNAI